MLGGLLTLSIVALGDALASRSVGSVRNLLFVLIAGASCVVITGLPEVFFPGLPERLMMVLKASLGPLAGAMALYFLGNWLGGVREDVLVHNLTALGGTVVLLVALALAAVSSQVDPMHFRARWCWGWWRWSARPSWATRWRAGWAWAWCAWRPPRWGSMPRV